MTSDGPDDESIVNVQSRIARLTLHLRYEL